MRMFRALIRHTSVALAGFVVGAAALYIASIRGGPPLETWHLVKLDNEFRAESGSGDDSFPDYLEREQRLFDELEAEVYAKTPTGPRFAFVRYSTGSEVDPRRFDRDWNRTFEWPVADPRGGVLLLHGMSDSPYSLRALGKTLHERGYWVVGLRLPGHGTVPSGLVTATWQDMSAAVSLAADHLRSVAGADRLHIVGYSTGAALALEHALATREAQEVPQPASLVMISPAIAISPAAAGASWLQRLSALPGLEKLGWTQILPEFDPFKYNSFAVNAGDQVHRLTRRLAGEIRRRATPAPLEDFPRTLVFLSTVDATVTPDAVIDNLLEHLAVDTHELVLFDINRSGVKTTLLASDPGPLTRRLIGNGSLPFHLTILGNESPKSRRIVARRKPPFSTTPALESIGVDWPPRAISLSHVALPIPADDPLYGARSASSDEILHLGDLAFQGERGLLRIPADWLLRLRFNPFYDYLEDRTVDWIEAR